MKYLKSFSRGGIHTRDYNQFTKDKPIRNAHIPAISFIPLHNSYCLVNPGDWVKEGMKIGKPLDIHSAFIHSPVPGKVLAIKDSVQPDGTICQAVVVECEGEFSRSGKNQSIHDWKTMSPSALLDKIADKGIVGLGGAAYPVHLKYKIHEGQKLDYFVVNGVECEPFLTCDHRLMLEKTTEILEAVRIVQRILKAGQVIIGIENNKREAIKKMQNQIAAQNLDFKVIPLKMRYPQGDERQLLAATIRREVPSGLKPIDIGAITSNIGTLYAIYEAIVYDKPLMERIVTVTGSIVNNPSNLKVRLGTRISELIEECDGLSEEPAKIITGGPLRGYAINDIHTPVSTTINGIVVLSHHEVRRETAAPCIQCGRCIRACPMRLTPNRLLQYLEHTDYVQAAACGLADCTECGCCSFVCPAKLPLVDSFRLGKIPLQKKCS